MNICKVAAASGVSMRMIRYYEKKGLLGPIKRSDSGNRIYSIRDVHFLEFIRCVRGLGYSMTEIRDLLGLWLDRTREPHELKAAAAELARDLSLKATAIGQVIDVFIELTESLKQDNRLDYPKLKKSSDTLQPASNQCGYDDLRYIGRGH